MKQYMACPVTNIRKTSSQIYQTFLFLKQIMLQGERISNLSVNDLQKIPQLRRRKQNSEFFCFKKIGFGILRKRVTLRPHVREANFKKPLSILSLSLTTSTDDSFNTKKKKISYSLLVYY